MNFFATTATYFTTAIGRLQPLAWSYAQRLVVTQSGNDRRC